MNNDDPIHGDFANYQPKTREQLETEGAEFIPVIRFIPSDGGPPRGWYMRYRNEQLDCKRAKSDYGSPCYACGQPIIEWQRITADATHKRHNRWRHVHCPT